MVDSRTCVQQLFGNSFNFEWSIASRCISLEFEMTQWLLMLRWLFDIFKKSWVLWLYIIRWYFTFLDNHGYKYQNWVFDLCIIVMINFDTHHDTQRGFGAILNSHSTLVQTPPTLPILGLSMRLSHLLYSVNCAPIPIIEIIKWTVYSERLYVVQFFFVVCHEDGIIINTLYKQT